MKIIKKQENPIAVQDWIPIKDISQNCVTLKDNSIVKILEVQPINFELKSEFEREAILENYRRFLKACSFDMQIIIQSQITDISEYLSKIKRLRNECDDPINEMSDDYINFIQEITSSRQNVSKKFYIVIKGDNSIAENVSKIREFLGSCENLVSECTTEEIINIMKNCFSKRLRGLERNNI